MTKALRIGLDLAPDDPYWVLVREAIYQSAEKCAIHLVSADAYSRRELTVQERISWIDELLALELDALISKDLPKQLCVQVLDSGLPMIYASESDVRHPRFATPFVLNRAAQMIGQYLAEQLSGQGSVLIVGGPESHSVNRVEGIHQALGKYPRIRQYHILGPWDYTQAYTIFLETMRTLPEPVDAIVGLSDSLALAGRHAVQRVGIANSNTLITGVNGDLLALAAIADGSMAATVETSATNFGSQLVDLACQAAGPVAAGSLYT